MPNAEEWCEVRANGLIFRDWTSVLVRYSMEDNWARHFQLELAEVTPAAAAAGQAGRVVEQPSLLDSGGEGRRIVQRLKPRDKVDILLAGQPAITGGVIKIRQSASDAHRHGVQVIGWSKAGPAGEVSINTKNTQFQNQSITQIANKVLSDSGIGVKFRLDNAPSGANAPFKNAIVHQGETPWDMIQRLARQRTLWLKIALNGDIVGGDGNPGGGAVLAEGVNIESISVYLEDPWAEAVLVKSQTAGSDEMWGRTASEISAKAGIPNGDPGKVVIVHAEDADRPKDAQMRADMEARAINAMTLRVTVMHRGWLKPGAKALWELQEAVTVRSPDHFPFAGGQMTLRVWAVTMSQDNSRGTITQVELVNEAAFSQRFPDAREPAPFGRTSSRAVLEGVA